MVLEIGPNAIKCKESARIVSSRLLVFPNLFLMEEN